jgi:hypothetical protein
LLEKLTSTRYQTNPGGISQGRFLVLRRKRMTVCKTFIFKQPKKGKHYRKIELLDNLAGSERMASTYYDPPRDELYTFFDEEHRIWKNVYDQQKGILYFSHRTITKLEKSPPWERTKVRHVFLHRKKQPAGVYEYLGKAIDEKRITVNGHDVRQLVIH